jgi:hypothetical protein
MRNEVVSLSSSLSPCTTRKAGRSLVKICCKDEGFTPFDTFMELFTYSRTNYEECGDCEH